MLASMTIVMLLVSLQIISVSILLIQQYICSWFFFFFGLKLYLSSSRDANKNVFLVGGEKLEEGSSVKAVVLDISRSDGLVDLSCKPELVSAASSAQKKVSIPSQLLNKTIK